MMRHKGSRKKKPNYESRFLVFTEFVCWMAAVVLLLPYILAVVGQSLVAWLSAETVAYEVTSQTNARVYSSRDFLPRVASVSTRPTRTKNTSQAALAAMEPKEKMPGAMPGTMEQNQSLWSLYRKALYDSLVSRGFVPPKLGMLHIPAQTRAIPIFAGESEMSMTLGAGHLLDTSPLQGNGNIAVSSHRDGPFRVLKDVAIGDQLKLEVANIIRTFTVTRIFIVEPEDISVLHSTSVPTLTLITCYPFYFIGKAPERYIVQAKLYHEDPMRRSQRASLQEQHRS